VYGVKASRITRIYNGISSSCFVQPPAADISRVRSFYGLHQPYILCLGTIETKKGVAELLRAFRIASERGVQECLVFAGGQGAPGLDIEEEIRKSHCERRVRVLGYVEEAEKKALIKASRLFVYPSLYEGFGLPPLEAMALGVPCVVSDQTSLPEVVGKAALLTQVKNASLFADALVQALHNDGVRTEVSVSGPPRAREFTWESSAAQLLEVCERLGGS